MLLFTGICASLLHRAIFTYLNSVPQDFSLPYEKLKFPNTLSYKKSFVRCINIFLDGDDVVSVVLDMLYLFLQVDLRNQKLPSFTVGLPILSH